MNINTLRDIAAEAQSKNVDVLLAEYGFQVRSSRIVNLEVLSVQRTVSWVDAEESDGVALIHAIDHVRKCLEAAQ